MRLRFKVRPYTPMWTRKELSNAMQEHGNGKAVARAYGVSKGKVYRACDHYGIPRTRGHSPGSSWNISKDDLADAYAIYGSIRLVAEKYERAKSVVYRKMLDYDIPRNKAGNTGLIHLKSVQRWAQMMVEGRDDEVLDEMLDVLAEKHERKGQVQECQHLEDTASAPKSRTVLPSEECTNL